MKNVRNSLLLALAMAVCALVSSAFAAPGGPTGTNGSYTLIFAGGFTGDGHAAVGGNQVATIDGNVTDAATGVTGTFKAVNLNLDNGHFTGTGTVMGVAVTVSGRVEAADGKVVLVPRLCCTFSTGSKGGRIFGEK